MDNYSCPEYGYNSNGAMTYDANKGISRIDYDQFGTTRRVQFANHSITEYVYAADGRRLKTRHRTSVPRSDMLGIYQTATLPSSETLSVDSTEYIGSYVCPNGQARRYNFDGGYLMLYNTVAIPRYYIKDHLGSNRVIVSSIGYINQHNIYYALGGNTALSSGQEYQQYKYTDKEYDPMHGLNQYDFGARNYDPAIGRFTSIDPLAEKYYHLTPYSYCGVSS